MALLTCVDCGRSVSDQAPVCPGCGRPASFATPGPTLARPSPAQFAGRAAGKMSPGVLAAVGGGTLLLLLAIPIGIGMEEDSRKKSAAVIDVKAAKDAEVRAAKESEAAASAKASEEAIALATAQKTRAEADEARTRSATMTRASRDNWISDCVLTNDCPTTQVVAIADGAPEGAERVHATKLHAASLVQKAAQGGRDGTTMTKNVVVGIAAALRNPVAGLPLLDLIPKASVAAAKKSPDDTRGKILRVSGTIIEIHSVDGFAEGSMSTDNMAIVHFLTPLATDGIYEDSWTTFEGVFVQEYDFSNVSGGQTKSLLAVGAFDIPANRPSH